MITTKQLDRIAFNALNQKKCNYALECKESIEIVPYLIIDRGDDWTWSGYICKKHAINAKEDYRAIRLSAKEIFYIQINDK